MLHLKSIWQDVLPLGIYRRTIGTLLNSVVEEMVQRVLILEDIAADAAVQIVTIFSALQDKAPEVFHLDKNKETSKGDIIRYVKKWNRFKELIGKKSEVGKIPREICFCFWKKVLDLQGRRSQDISKIFPKMLILAL